MASPKAKAPSLRYHTSGQSVVIIDGKDCDDLDRQSAKIPARDNSSCRSKRRTDGTDSLSRLAGILAKGHGESSVDKRKGADGRQMDPERECYPGARSVGDNCAAGT